jgi:hypothetical protein
MNPQAEAIGREVAEYLDKYLSKDDVTVSWAFLGHCSKLYETDRSYYVKVYSGGHMPHHEAIGLHQSALFELAKEDSD